MGRKSLKMRSSTIMAVAVSVARLGREGDARKPYHTRIVVWIFILLGWMVVGTGCATKPSAQGPRQAAVKAPIWAVQLNWTREAGLGLQLQYNSLKPTLAGAYKSTKPVFPYHTNAWHSVTWKLMNVQFAGRENAGADLRLCGSHALAVHKVVLSLRPPPHFVPGTHFRGGPSVSITFNTGQPGKAATNTDHNLRQVDGGGNIGDSLYTCGVIAGRGAEIFARHINVSYIYLRLSRNSRLFQVHPTVVYATVTYAATTAIHAWPVRTFGKIAADGIHHAEINMEWGEVEPQRGKFNFTLLDQTLANAAKAHVQIIPIFWYAVWANNPPAWITQYDVGSSGAKSQVPTWWSHFNRQSYFQYVTATIAHIKNNPAFGGAFLNFGWLDYMWGPAPGDQGVNGYAPRDIAKFHQWLPARYHVLPDFNRRYHTHYTAWTAVPAARPGQRLFSVYQHFRNWSVIETYKHLTQLVRRDTTAPLYYYWGGGYSGAGLAFNLPDSFFQLARRYHVTVCQDCADHGGLMVLFGSLAKAYKVPLFEEWTPEPSGLHAEITQFLGHYGFEMPDNAGMDFFLYDGGKVFKIGYGPYVHWIPVLNRIHGRYPQQPVAIYISYRKVFAHPTALGGLNNRLGNIWRKLHLAFTVVTNREVKAGRVQLQKFRAIFPITGRHDAAITQYAAHGGRVLEHAAQLADYAPAYVTFAPATAGLEVVPTVDSTNHSAWMTLSPWRLAPPYKGVVTIHVKALGLPAGRYRIINAATGKPIAGIAGGDGLRVPLNIVPGTLMVWHIVPK